MTMKDPEIVAELRALYPRYEEALVANDADPLVSTPVSEPSAAIAADNSRRCSH
ncbi:MAG: hypothetical protein ABSG62_09350 [Terracidiphilus sp.]|jgi:hypothetical protein